MANTILQNIDARMLEVSALIADLGTAGVGGGGPNTTGAGVNVDHTGYKASLYKELADLRLERAEEVARTAGPFDEIMELW